MLNVSTRFAKIANAVTNTVSELLYAPVCVVNHKGVIITRSIPQPSNAEATVQDAETALEHFLRIPLRHETEIGEILVGEPLNQEAISPRLAHALVELVIHQTTTQSQPDYQELKNQLIYDLLHGHVGDDAVIHHRAKQLGIDLTPPRAVILIDASAYILNTQESAKFQLKTIEQQRRVKVVIRSIVSFFHLPNDTICADLGQGQIAVLKASDTKNLDLWVNREDGVEASCSSWANLVALRRAADALLLRLKSDTGATVNLGIGRYHPGVCGLTQSYEDARVALSLGIRFQGTNRVYCLGELGIAAFVGVSDQSTKIDLAKYLLSPLNHEPELLETLNIFFEENCCPSSTAKRLSIHRNTLSYRLDKICSLTGLDPRKFDQAMQMRLSLLLRSL